MMTTVNSDGNLKADTVHYEINSTVCGHQSLVNSSMRGNLPGNEHRNVYNDFAVVKSLRIIR